MTVAEMSAKMSTREFAEQMIYDKLVKEAGEIATLDRQLLSDHARNMVKVQ